MTTTLAPRHRPTASERSAPWAPLLVVLAGTFVTFLDFFIVNVALPSIHVELRAGPSAVSLVVAGYGLTFAVGMITGGRLGDLYGRRRLFVVGMTLFTLTSLACGVAPNVGVLIAARVAQGAAGALLTPQVLAILGTTYLGRQRDKAFASFGLAMGIAGVLGQLVGGALIEWDVGGLAWRSIFLVNLPVGVVVVPLAVRFVPESWGARTRLDPVGVLVGTAALVALVLPLVEGRQHGWPAWTWVCLFVAPVLGAGFVAHQRHRARRGRSPLVDPGLFRTRSFAVGSLVAMFFALVPSSFFFVLALYLQQGRGFGPLFSGVVFVAVGAGYFVAMFVANRLAARLGRQVLALGAGVVVLGCAALVAAVGNGGSLALVPGLALIGFGIGTVLVPLSSTVLTDVDPLHAGAAAGVLSTAQQLGGALGVTVIGIAFFTGAPIATSFTHSLFVVVGLAALAACTVQFLPRRED